MKTIICGAGDVGYSIADKLSRENFEVTVIDEDENRLNKVSETLDVKTINGIPSMPSVLESAGANDCEILIAVTKSDETNMVTCQIGHSLFKIKKKIARIRQQDYLKNDWKNLYNSTMSIVPGEINLLNIPLATSCSGEIIASIGKLSSLYKFFQSVFK